MQILPPELEQAFQQATHLVGLGAQKAGTSWLHSYLMEHPQVCESPIKELHHFDARFLPALCGHFNARFLEQYQRHGKGELYARLAMHNDEAAYLDYFRLLYGGERVFSEITPAYAMLDRRAFAHIDSLHPATKYHFVLRNPADRVWSHINFDARRPQSNLEQARRCFEEGNPHYVLRSDYRRTLTELWEAVDRDRVLVLFYEQLFTDSALADFCEFLGIEFRPGAYAARVSATAKAPLDSATRAMIVRRLEGVYRFVHDHVTHCLPPSWLKDLELLGPAGGAYAAPLRMGRTPAGPKRQPNLSGFSLSASSPLGLLAMAELLLRKQDHARAREALERALALDPALPGAHFLRSKLLARHGLLQEALDAAGRAASLAPDAAAYRHHLGNLLRKAGDLEAAAQAQRQAMALAPELPGPAYQLSLIMEQQGDLEGALELARTASALQQGSAAFRRHLRRLEGIVGQA